MHTQPNSYAKPSKSSVLRRLAAYYKPYRRVFRRTICFCIPVSRRGACHTACRTLCYIHRSYYGHAKGAGYDPEIRNYDADPRTDPVVQQLLHL